MARPFFSDTDAASDDAVGRVDFDRCPLAKKELGCDSQTLPLVAMEGDHHVACFVVDKAVREGELNLVPADDLVSTS
jgi:hypothetical protein